MERKSWSSFLPFVLHIVVYGGFAVPHLSLESNNSVAARKIDAFATHIIILEQEPAILRWHLMPSLNSFAGTFFESDWRSIIWSSGWHAHASHFVFDLAVFILLPQVRAVSFAFYDFDFVANNTEAISFVWFDIKQFGRLEQFWSIWWFWLWSHDFFLSVWKDLFDG